MIILGIWNGHEHLLSKRSEKRMHYNITHRKSNYGLSLRQWQEEFHYLFYFFKKMLQFVCFLKLIAFCFVTRFYRLWDSPSPSPGFVCFLKYFKFYPQAIGRSDIQRVMDITQWGGSWHVNVPLWLSWCRCHTEWIFMSWGCGKSLLTSMFEFSETLLEMGTNKNFLCERSDIIKLLPLRL